MKKYTPKKIETNTVNEPMAIYGSISTDDRSIFSLIERINNGIKFSVFEKIMYKYNFSLQNWADFLHISTKTLSRYQKENKAFDVLQTERIMQIELLYQRGEEVFGDCNHFNYWLEAENLALGNRIPKNLLGNSFGIQLLMDELTRIEHGVLL